MIELYSTNCPNCRILKDKLKEKGIEFTENNSVDQMLELGFTHVPILKVDDKIYDFNEALMFIKKY